MEGQGRRSSQVITAEFRQTAVWKQWKLSAFVQGGFLACDIIMLIMMSVVAFTGGTGWMVPVSWAGGSLAGYAAKKLRKPTPGGGQLVAGSIGMVAAVLFHLSQKVLMLILSAALLGFSAIWAMVSGQS